MTFKHIITFLADRLCDYSRSSLQFFLMFPLICFLDHCRAFSHSMYPLNDAIFLLLLFWKLLLWVRITPQKKCDIFRRCVRRNVAHRNHWRGNSRVGIEICNAFNQTADVEVSSLILCIYPTAIVLWDGCEITRSVPCRCRSRKFVRVYYILQGGFFVIEACMNTGPA